MYRYIYILLFIFTTSTLWAQNAPERSLVRKGNRQFNKGNYELSIERYEQALKVDPTSSEALYNLGNALYKAERFDKSEQTLVAAAADTLRSETERAESFYNLGNSQFQQKKYQEALESYKSSLRLNPSDQETKYNYAYTKKLLDKDKNGGGGGDDDKKDQDKDKDKQDQDQQGDKNKDQNQPDKGDKDKQENQNQDQQGEDGDNKEQNGQPQSAQGEISKQEQEQMLNAIQAQEEKTQEKLKEKQGVVVRGGKNW